MILYHKSNLVYTVVFTQFLIFQKNNNAETLRKLTLTSGHYYFVEIFKNVEKQLCQLNCSYGNVSDALNYFEYKLTHIITWISVAFFEGARLGHRSLSHESVVSAFMVRQLPIFWIWSVGL